jgi:hypothetical protein
MASWEFDGSDGLANAMGAVSVTGDGRGNEPALAGQLTAELEKRMSPADVERVKQIGMTHGTAEMISVALQVATRNTAAALIKRLQDDPANRGIQMVADQIAEIERSISTLPPLPANFPRALFDQHGEMYKMD